MRLTHGPYLFISPFALLFPNAGATLWPQISPACWHLTSRCYSCRKGLSFIHSSVNLLQRSLRSSAEYFAAGQLNDSTGEARETILHLVNLDLRKSERPAMAAAVTVSTSSPSGTSSSSGAFDIASVQNLIDNAVLDLILMVLWELVKLDVPLSADGITSGHNNSSSDDIKADDETIALLNQPLPAYFFARDDRVTTQFCQRLRALQHYYDSTAGARAPTTATDDGMEAEQAD